MIMHIQQSQDPVHGIGLFLLFFSVVGIVALFSGKKVRRWWKRVTRSRNFWGIVTAGFLFVGFSMFYLFLAFRKSI